VIAEPRTTLEWMHRVVASWFGTGLILGRIRGNDLGSGTVGSLFALPIAVLIGETAGWPWQILAAAVVTVASVWAARPFVSREGDAGWICADEAAGVFIAVIGLQPGPAVLAWIVFRLADIFKHIAPGVSAAEIRLPGAIGVTADDVVAGLYGLAAGHLLQGLI
jgi:phosphatidylglycerophosphatase A